MYNLVMDILVFYMEKLECFEGLESGGGVLYGPVPFPAGGTPSLHWKPPPKRRDGGT